MAKDDRTNAQIAVTSCFEVKVDNESLGYFSSCDGLGMEVVLEQREEGGCNGFVWQLPTRIKYPNIKLSRPVCADTSKIASWFAKLLTGFEPTTAVISARTLDDKPIAEWELIGVVPVRWTGPSLSIDSPKVATESLELAHHGILPPAAGAQ